MGILASTAFTVPESSSSSVLVTFISRPSVSIEPLTGSDCQAGQAYMNICKRVLGEEVPYLDLEVTKTFFHLL